GLHQQPDCFACGPVNPAGLHGTFVADGEEVRGNMGVTEAMGGAPGRLHRGAEPTPASLTVDLRAPAYVGAVLTQRGWVDRREGRKWFLRSEVHEDGCLLAEAHGLCI